MQRRTHPAISLGPTGNMQGSYKFSCLTTDKLLVRRRFTPMAGIPTTVINAVLRFADKKTGLMELLSAIDTMNHLTSPTTKSMIFFSCDR